MKRAGLLLFVACHSSASTSTTTSASTRTPTPTPTLAPTQTPTPTRAPHTVTLAPHGIGFDDLVFAPTARRVLAPAGATGKLVVIDPTSFSTESLVAFEAASPAYTPGHHDDGVTSAAETPQWLVATDRTHKSLDAFSASKLAKHVPLAAEPDYVRWVAQTSELWVTEPDASQIEVFSSALASIAKIPVPGGPESLVVSDARKAAYSNLWHKKSVEIDVASRSIKRTFDSGCDKTRGIALDDVTGALFVACNDGRTVKIDLASGKVAAEGRAGDGVDIIDWSPSLSHLYVPASRAGTMTVFDAALQPLATVPVPKGAHCVVADDQGNAWVCDTDHGAVIAIPDPKRPEK